MDPNLKAFQQQLLRKCVVKIKSIKFIPASQVVVSLKRLDPGHPLLNSSNSNRRFVGRTIYKRKCKAGLNYAEAEVGEKVTFKKKTMKNKRGRKQHPFISTTVCSACGKDFLEDTLLNIHENECPFILRATKANELSIEDFCHQLGLVLKNGSEK